MSLIIGIDPDSSAHGVAFYKDGILVDLAELQLLHIIEYTKKFDTSDEKILFCIEDVCANNFVYKQKQTKRAGVNMDIARKVGKCQQSQIELIRFLEFFNIQYKLFKPQAGNWANNEEQFKRLTGWAKRSNKDTRSAAFFGYLGGK